MKSKTLVISWGGQPPADGHHIDAKPGSAAWQELADGLAWGDGTLEAILLDGVLDHLSLAQGAALLRECRRVLTAGGRVAIRLSDVRELLRGYVDGKGVPEHDGQQRMTTDIERLVDRFRGGCWQYDEAELVRVAGLAGLEATGEVVTSDGLLEMHFRRPDRRVPEEPLVSILLAAYSPRFFEVALESALQQTYRNIEIVICDDCPDDGIERIARRHAEIDGRIRYLRNPQRLMGHGNYARCFREARGEFIKYLNDDDLLAPTCVERMLEAFRQHPDATLVTSHRQRIDENGSPLDDIAATRPMVESDAVIDGVSLCNYVLQTGINTIGEPSTFMFRRRDIEHNRPHPFSFAGVEIKGIVDVSVAVGLLGKGDAVYLTESLSAFRNHADQRQLQPGIMEICQENWERLRARAAELGLHDPDRELHLRYRPCGQNQWHTDLYRVRGERAEPSAEQQHYEQWIERTALSEGDAQILAERMMQQWQHRPAIHLITVLRAGQEHLLAPTLESLQQQLYHGWGLTVIASTPAPDPAFESLDMLEWIVTDEEAAQAVWRVVEHSPGDWVALIEAGDSFEPDWLFEQVSYVNIRPEWKMLYCDEDRIDEYNTRSDPQFKPDFDPDLLCSMPYLGQACLVAKEALLRAGGIDVEAGLWNHDLAFRVLEAYGDTAIGHVPKMLVHRLTINAEAWDATGTARVAMRMVERHLERTGRAGQVEAGLVPGTCLVDYRHAEQPLVSIIVPTRDQGELLEDCINSLLAKTAYRNFEVLIVDNGSTEARALCFLESVEVASDRVRVLRYPHAYNYSAINNFAARHAQGDYLLLLNNDTRIVQERWLERMMSHAQRPEVGVVGARLVFADQHLQHAGVVIGMGGVADHVHGGLPMADAGYMARAQVVQQFSAVTGACLLIRRSVFEQVGGLDEDVFPVLYNDVDLCLKVRRCGLRVVWTPFATLVHHGSVSLLTEEAGRERIERNLASRQALQQKWIPLGYRDPAWNPGLDLSTRLPRIETEMVPGWNPDLRDKTRVLGLPYDDGGCGTYRIREPLHAVHDAAVFQTACAPSSGKGRLPGMGELARLAPDVLLLQSFVLDQHLDSLAAWRQAFPELFMVFELDDLKTNLPAGNPFSHTMPPDIADRLRRALARCDRMIVSTEPLAEAHADLIGDIRVVPNRLSKARWTGLHSLRRQGRKPRVGWAGAQQHHGDLAVLDEVVPALADEVEWVFLGMCPKNLRPHVHEFHEAVAFDSYPARLAGLNLDLAVAPLELHPFNEAKSHLRLLEYGIMGWPVVCTDIFPYQQAPVKRVANDPKAWIEAIRERVHDADAREREGDALRAWVLQHWMLEDHLGDWVEALSPNTVLARQRTAAAG